MSRQTHTVYRISSRFSLETVVSLRVPSQPNEVCCLLVGALSSIFPRAPSDRAAWPCLRFRAIFMCSARALSSIFPRPPSDPAACPCLRFRAIFVCSARALSCIFPRAPQTLQPARVRCSQQTIHPRVGSASQTLRANGGRSCACSQTCHLDPSRRQWPPHTNMYIGVNI